ncbi:hypothetical protein AB0F15_26080 [Amycolatopsis sp. NPDC026612]|uniref:hypothetical protein n=1 Tax=Amycolatopsis sp. NPDC026612 TaxID=3155466 RepID=UPI0033C253DB
MGGVLRDALGVARCTAMAAGIPAVFRYVCRDANEVTRSFDAVVAPLIEQAIGDDSRLAEDAYNALLATSVKVGLAMWGYAAMAGVPFDAALAALGSSFTRIYDDLVDNFAGHRLDDRLAGLFRGEVFVPLSGPETLLLLIYRAIETAVARPADDPLFPIMRELHEYEWASRAQRDPRISALEVQRITRGKGGLGLTALFALLRPGMSAEERVVLLELGDVLQLLDDFHDVAIDHRDGVVTAATHGGTDVAGLAAKIRRLRTGFRRYYGPGRDRRLAAMLFVMLAGALVASRRRVDRPRAVAAPRRRRTVFMRLFAQAGNLTPGPRA